MITNRKKGKKRKKRTEANESYENYRLQKEMKRYNFLIILAIYKFPYLSADIYMYISLMNSVSN